LISRSVALHGVELTSRWWNSHAPVREDPDRYFSMSSLTSDDGAHALGAHLLGDRPGTVSVPSTGWPPVIATASL
jgi:hypothetical protein